MRFVGKANHVGRRVQRERDHIHAAEYEAVLVRLMAGSQVVVVQHADFEDGVVGAYAHERNRQTRNQLRRRGICLISN